MYGRTMLVSSRHKSDVVRLTYQLNDCSISALTHPMFLVFSVAYRRYLRSMMG